MLLSALILLGLILLVMTVVGHGLWVLAGAIVAHLKGLSRPKPEPLILAAICPGCGTLRGRGESSTPCRLCGRAADPGRAAERPRPDLALAQLRRWVERYATAGLIEPAARERIEAALLAEEQRLARAEPERTVWEAIAAPARPAERGDRVAQVASKLPALARPAPAVAKQVAGLRELQQARADMTTVVPDRPHRLVDLFAAFLEERSIRWGELVGGLLIVGCSLALVISFWASIAERPWVKYGLLNGVTALLFGLGFRAERRWKLPTTARGLAIIATLLTPLNFLAVASLAGGSAAGSGWSLAGEVLAVMIFAPLVLRAGRVLVAGAPWALGLSVVAPSAMMLLAARSIHPGSGPLGPLGLGGLPWLAAAVGLGGWLVGRRREGPLAEPRAVEVLRLLGLGGFAAGVALGLVIAHAGPVAQAGGWLAWLTPLIGGTILMPGVWLWGRAEARTLVGYRTAGAALATAGTMILLAGLVLAWPAPARVGPIAALDALALTLIALGFRVPAVHALAGGCLALVYLLGWGVATGRLAGTGAIAPPVAEVLLGGSSAAALVPFALIYAALAGLQARLGRQVGAQAHAVVAGLAGLASLGLATWHGFGVAGDPVGATWVYAAFAVACPILAAGWRRCPLVPGTSGVVEARGLGWLGSGLLLAALVQELVFGGWGPDGSVSWVMALLAHASATTGLGTLPEFVARWSWNPHRDQGPDAPEFAPVRPAGVPEVGLAAAILDRSAGAATGVAAGLIVLATPFAPAASLAGCAAWLAALWVVLALRWGSAGWFGAGQAALAWGVVLGVAAGWHRPDRLDARTIQAEALALGGLCLGTIGLRVAICRRRSKGLSRIEPLLDPPWVPVDRWLRGVVVLGLVALAGLAALPGTARELAPRLAVDLPGWAGAAASGVPSWALLGLTLVILLAGQWERFRRPDLLGALAVATLAAPLVAGRFEPSRAVAAAWLWASAGVILAGSALVWGRASLRSGAGWLGWRIEAGELNGLPTLALGVVLGLGLAPAGLMAGMLVGSVGHPATAEDRLVQVGFGASLALALLGVVGWSGRSGLGRLGAWFGPFAVVLGLFPPGAGLVFLVASRVVAQHSIADPVPGSFFGRVGAPGTVVPPLLMVVGTLVGSALRERSARFAFAAGVGLLGTATLAVILQAAEAGSGPDAAFWVRLAQVNAVVAAASALAWLSGRVLSARWRAGEPGGGESGLGLSLAALAVAFAGLPLAGGMLAIWLDPGSFLLARIVAGPWGAGAVLLAAGVVLARSRWLGKPLGPAWVGFGLICLASFTALGLGHRDHGHWFTYHGVLIGQAMAAIALPLLAWRQGEARGTIVPDPVRAGVVRWSLVALGIVVLFAVRGYGADPQAPGWTVGALMVMAGLAAGLAGWAGRPGLLRLGSGLINLAATAWWSARPAGWWPAPGNWGWAAPVLVNALALAIPAPLWSRIERQGRPEVWTQAGAWHRQVAWGALALLAAVVGCCLASGGLDGTGRPLGALGWGAVAATLLAFGSGSRDARVRPPVAGLYALGLVVAGWAVVPWGLSPRWLAWAGMMILAAYAVITSTLWHRRAALGQVAGRWGIPRRADGEPGWDRVWLVPATLTLVGGVVAPAGGMILADPSLLLRLSAAQAVLAGALAIGLLVRGARGDGLPGAAHGVAILGAVLWGWAWVAPASPTAPLDRAAATLAGAVAGATLCGLGLARFGRAEDGWGRAAWRVIPVTLGLAGLVLVAILLVEVADRTHGLPVAMATPAVAALALTIVGAVGAALAAAIAPGRDPLGLTERGRTAYVYGAEVLLAVLGAHLKLSLPWLLAGRFRHYWPLFLMGVAFGGVGLSEVFRRQRRLVLAEPLERTGALLPVVPLLAALWSAPRPGEDVVYLLLVAIFYAILAALRSSSGFAALAALAGNGTFWAWLSHQDRLSLLAHPQLWVVPPALCVLVGAVLNRDRLTRAQLVATQYGALMAIYLASTGDIVLTGVAQAPWLPVVLAALAVAGIFAGICLRVRGFLFLGTGFLGLALFSVIWYAAVDLHQTWLWAASGVVTGSLILAVFAVFEKKRHDVLRVVGQLKEWNP